MLETLSKAERTVLELLYGLTDGFRRTYEIAAFETHIPISMIKGYEASALDKLRRPSSISKLKQLFCEHMNDIGTTKLDSFNIAAALADLNASIDAGEFTEEEQATLDLLASNLPDEFKDLFE